MLIGMFIKLKEKNGTGWCSKESIAKRNAPKYQSIMQINVAKRGNKRKSIETQIARELHPSQNLKLQSKKAFSIQLRKAGINYIGMHH